MESNQNVELTRQKVAKILYLFIVAFFVLVCLLCLNSGGPRAGVDDETLLGILSQYNYCSFVSEPIHVLDKENGIESYTYLIRYDGSTYTVAAELYLQFDWDDDEKCWVHTEECTNNTYLSFRHPDSIPGGYMSNIVLSEPFPIEVNYIRETRLEFESSQSAGLFGNYGVSVVVEGGAKPFYSTTAGIKSETGEPAKYYMSIDMKNPTCIEVLVAPHLRRAKFLYLN